MLPPTIKLLLYAFWSFSPVGEEVDVKTTIGHYGVACLIYAAAHNKQFLLSHIFMPSIDFCEYHKNRKLMVFSALLPTHTCPHHAAKADLLPSKRHTWILIFLCVALKTSWEITNLRHLHKNLYFWNSKNRVSTTSWEHKELELGGFPLSKIMLVLWLNLWQLHC